MAEPLAQNSPAAMLPKVLSKYANPSLQQMPDDVLGPVMQMDLDRARKGQSPLSAGETMLALQAAQSGQEVIKQPQPGFFGRALNDLEGVVQSIPHLPGALVNEFGALPQAPAQIAKGLSDQSISEIAQAPGVRMLPGSYFAQHGLMGFWEHPIIASLDVAPAIEKGAGLIPETVTAPAKAVAADTLDRFGLGPVSQDVSRRVAVANRQLTTLFNQHALNVADITKGLSDEDIVRLTDIAKRGAPDEIAQLSKADQATIGQLRQATNDLAAKGQALGMLGQFDGEIYPIKDANRLQGIRQKFYDAMARGDDAAANSLLKDFRRINDQTVPGRFRSLLDDEFQNRLTALARSRNPEAVGDAWDQVTKMINNRFYDMVPNVTDKDLSKLAAEITPTWQALKDEGYDPVFMHSVRGDQIGRLRNPKVFAGQEVSPTSVREKTWNMAPSINNFAVGLNHQGLEFLQHEVTAQVIDEIKSVYGKTRADLINEYIPYAEKLGSGPDVGLSNKVEHLISKEYVKWDPEGMFPYGRGGVNAGLTPKEDLYLPKTVQKTLEKMYPIDRSQLGRLWDATMGVFRVGILPLSPRWHLYNTLGGAAMLAGRTGPEVFKYLGDAIEMAKSGKMPEGISHGMISVPEDVRAWNYEAGQQIARMVKDHWGQGAIDKVGGPLSTIVNKSYALNEFVDNMYRAMGYLYGKDKALVKGLSEDEAHAAGVKLSNKILQDWDAMTPIERQVIRSIFPFYGWAKHIMNYVMTYPWDHPYRASIIANFARNEMDDWKSGVPSQFQNYLFFGKPDQYGNQTGINLRGANPFADVANYFTLAGFVSQMNPMLTGLMTAMGFNPRTGSASTNPTLTVDPDTGKLVPVTKNPFATIAEGLVPQAQGISSLLGLDTPDLQQLKLNNPTAYRQMILSSFGLPSLPKSMNLNLEAARAELARNTVLQQTISDAIKTGDYKQASKYPALKPIIVELKKLEKSGALDQLRIQPEGSSQFDVKQLLPSIRGQGIG